MIAVALIGEHRIDANSMNRKGSRRDTVDLASKDKGDRMEEVMADPYRRAFNWYDGHMGENPLDAIVHRETRDEILAALTDKQREVSVMFYRDAMSQRKIAEILGINHRAVGFRLEVALEKAKKFF